VDAGSGPARRKGFGGRHDGEGVALGVMEKMWRTLDGGDNGVRGMT
jgi:hypothetical protein